MHSVKIAIEGSNPKVGSTNMQLMFKLVKIIIFPLEKISQLVVKMVKIEEKLITRKIVKKPGRKIKNIMKKIRTKFQLKEEQNTKLTINQKIKIQMKIIQMVIVIQVNVPFKYTVWKFKNFSATRNLLEINLDHFKVSKIAIFEVLKSS